MTTASRSSTTRSTPSPNAAPPTGSATPASDSTPWPASSPKPKACYPTPSTTPATRTSPGPKSGNCSTPARQPQRAATEQTHDQLDQDHRHNVDVRTPSQARTMVPWHGRQTMEIEDDSNPEDDA